MSDAFEVRPFAFMRLTHEAIRDGVGRCLALADRLVDQPEAETLGELEQVYTQTRRCIDVHAAIEDAGFFPLLDEGFGGVCAREGFQDQHREEERRHDELQQALGALGRTGARAEAAYLRDLVATWQAEVERHLVHEEEVMMPLTERVADTIEGRAEAVRRIIDTRRDEVEGFMIPWVAARLEASKPFGPLRMFVSAVQISHGPQDRARIEPALRAALSAEAVGRLEQAGALG